MNERTITIALSPKEARYLAGLVDDDLTNIAQIIDGLGDEGEALPEYWRKLLSEATITWHTLAQAVGLPAKKQQ